MANGGAEENRSVNGMEGKYFLLSHIIHKISEPVLQVAKVAYIRDQG